MIFLYLTAGGGGSLICEIILANYVLESSSILDICRVDGMVFLRVVTLCGRMLLSSNCGNIMENNTCHNNVTCCLLGYPQVLRLFSRPPAPHISTKDAVLVESWNIWAFGEFVFNFKVGKMLSTASL